MTAEPGAAADGLSPRRRLLVVSSPSVVSVNQVLYRHLWRLGWDVLVVVPSIWRHEYSSELFRPRRLPEFEDRILPVRVVRPGRPQRHVYLTQPRRILQRFSPDVIFLEQEPYSLPAAQWGFVAWRARVPFGVQAYENLDRQLPLPARLIRSWVLGRASFVTARSPTAADLVREWGARGRVALIPPAVSLLEDGPALPRNGFTIGFAGRLVDEKGVRDLIRAAKGLAAPTRLLLVGDGPLRRELAEEVLPNGSIEIVSNLAHEEMSAAYRQMDVLVLPSRTTDKWAEQFGRVLIEALSFGVPVVGSNSGEIPWVIEETQGGFVFPEGDVDALREILIDLQRNPGKRDAFGQQGAVRAKRLFGMDIVGALMDATLANAVDSRSM